MLVAVAELLVDGVFRPHVFIERDAYGAVAHHNALVERAYLGVDVRQGQVGNPFLQFRERVSQSVAYVVHVGVFQFHVADQRLQCRVLVEPEEALADVVVADVADAQYLLHEGACLYWVLGVHLLQGREVARDNIAAFQTVIPLHLHV